MTAPYNDIQMWRYAELPAVFGDASIRGRRAAPRPRRSCGVAFTAAAEHRDKLVLIEAASRAATARTGLERLGRSFRAAQPNR